MAEILRVEGASQRREPVPASRPEVFRLPVERIRDGLLLATPTSTQAKELLEGEDRHPRVTMQVFQKEESVLGGIDEAIAILRAVRRRPSRRRLGDGWEELEVRALHEGDEVAPHGRP